MAKDLSPKYLEMRGCLFCLVPTDALVLKHQAISKHNAHKMSDVQDQLHIKISFYNEQHYKIILNFEKKKTTQRYKG